jgi:DNA-binding NarL/FixJ family response regulator
MFGTYWVARSEYAGGSAVRLAVRVRRNDLTPRELEVALLLERDLSNDEIARELGIKLGTVKTHVHNILKKPTSPQSSRSKAQRRRWRRWRAARSDDNT